MIVALAVVETAGIPVGALQAVQQRIVARAAGGAAGTADGAVAGAIAAHVIGFLAPGGAGGDGDLSGPVGEGRAADREVSHILHLVRKLDRARTPFLAAIDPVLGGFGDRGAEGIVGHAAFRAPITEATKDWVYGGQKW